MKNFQLILLVFFTCNGVLSQESNVFLDNRDETEYSIIEIGNQIWMGENLRFNMLGSYVYMDRRGYEEVYGRLYQWDIAILACPDGWHLPTSEEWNQLIEFLGGMNKAGLYFNQTLNKNADDTEARKYEFNSIPAGFRDPFGNYGNLEEYAYYWTATEGDSTAAVRKMVANKGMSIGSGYGNKSSAYSVRCIKDKD